MYGNKILDNVVDGDGTKGQGAGILMGGGAPGAGVYDNLIEGNTANGNGSPASPSTATSSGRGLRPQT